MPMGTWNRRRYYENAANLISDSFNRADNASSLLNADTGQTWVALNGTWGTLGNKAYLAVDGSGGRRSAGINAGSTNGVLTCTADVTGDGWNLIFRAQDKDNLLFITLSGTTLLLRKWVAAVGTDITTAPGLSFASGDAWRVTLNGSSIDVAQNGTSRINTSDATFLGNTIHGIGQGVAPGTLRFENWSFSF